MVVEHSHSHSHSPAGGGARPGMKLFCLGGSLMLIAGHISAREKQLADHRRGACSEIAREENQLIKQCLEMLRKRVLDEAQREGTNLPPLSTRIEKIFNTLVTEEETG